jgi:hypothetical protein
MPIKAWNTQAELIPTKATTPKQFLQEISGDNDPSLLSMRPILTMEGARQVPMMRGGQPLFGVYKDTQLVATYTVGTSDRDSIERGVAPEFVVSRDGNDKGRLTGGSRNCRLEGCTGRRLEVRWPDGKLTWPCSKGMVRSLIHTLTGSHDRIWRPERPFD